MSAPRPAPPWSPAAPRWLAGLLWLAAAGFPGVSAPVDFAHDIVPLLRQHCGECHTGAQQKGGLSFNTRETLLKGGENGPVVKPGDSAHSRLLAVVTASDPDEQMPPKGHRLAKSETDLLRRWISEGAVWPEFRPAPTALTPLA
ncbi:MAG: c-type cytochrome domain-containing protein, partial [Verrucomicrobiota bacterium]